MTALALAMWLVFHFLLTRRTARLVHAAEQLAAGNLAARSGLKGSDELGRLSRAFDAMALDVAETQTRLRQDIAERARVQRELENSEARLQQILNNAHRGGLRQGHRRPAAVRQPAVGASLPFAPGRRAWERPNGETLPEEVRRRHFATTTCSSCSAMRRWSSRRPRRSTTALHTYISIKFPLHDANGEAYAVCGISTDITERKRSDEALRVSEASYRAIFDAAEDAIFVHDIDTGAIVDVNPRACATFGYTPRGVPPDRTSARSVPASARTRRRTRWH